MVKVPLGQGSFAKVPLDQVPLGQVPLVKVPLTPNHFKGRMTEKPHLFVVILFQHFVPILFWVTTYFSLLQVIVHHKISIA